MRKPRVISEGHLTRACLHPAAKAFVTLIPQNLWDTVKHSRGLLIVPTNPVIGNIRGIKNTNTKYS